MQNIFIKIISLYFNDELHRCLASHLAVWVVRSSGNTVSDFNLPL